MMNKSDILRRAILMSLCLITITFAGTDRTILKRKGREQEFIDSVSYRRTLKEYRVTKGKITFPISEKDVEYVKPPKPEGFDKCQNISELENIVKKYHKQWWDVEAFKRLMPLCLKKGEHAKAVQLCRDMKPVIGDNMPLSVHQAYWTALRLSGQKNLLKKELAEMITQDSRKNTAWAYLARGDFLLSEGKRREALIDGFLKVIILFKDIKSCRRQALEKTIAALEEAGDTRAEKFRRMLKIEFPAQIPGQSTPKA